jgi:hypothetical protein
MTNLLSGLASPAPQPLSVHDSPLQTGRPREVEANPDASLRSGDWHCLSDAKYILEIRSFDSPERLHASNRRLVRSL